MQQVSHSTSQQLTIEIDENTSIASSKEDEESLTEIFNFYDDLHQEKYEKSEQQEQSKQLKPIEQIINTYTIGRISEVQEYFQNSERKFQQCVYQGGYEEDATNQYHSVKDYSQTKIKEEQFRKRYPLPRLNGRNIKKQTQIYSSNEDQVINNATIKHTFAASAQKKLNKPKASSKFTKKHTQIPISLNPFNLPIKCIEEPQYKLLRQKCLNMNPSDISEEQKSQYLNIFGIKPAKKLGKQRTMKQIKNLEEYLLKGELPSEFVQQFSLMME